MIPVELPRLMAEVSPQLAVTISLFPPVIPFLQAVMLNLGESGKIIEAKELDNNKLAHVEETSVTTQDLGAALITYLKGIRLSTILINSFGPNDATVLRFGKIYPNKTIELNTKHPVDEVEEGVEVKLVREGE